MWESLMGHMSTIVPFLTAIASGFFVWIGTRTSAGRDITINDRQQLSQDQVYLIQELKDMIQELKDETDELKEQGRRFQEANVTLTITNEKLQLKLELNTEENEKLRQRLEQMNAEYLLLQEQLKELSKRLDNNK